jgi:hypothetical protein
LEGARDECGELIGEPNYNPMDTSVYEVKLTKDGTTLETVGHKTDVDTVLQKEANCQRVVVAANKG